MAPLNHTLLSGEGSPAHGGDKRALKLSNVCHGVGMHMIGYLKKQI